MKNHIWRPLLVALGGIILVLTIRTILVPKDFGAHERGYMYGWHRKGNEAEWKAVTVKYRTSEACKECHDDNYRAIKASAHADISCENCHGPLGRHPDNPAKLAIDKERSLCLRCHLRLPYAASDRGSLPAIDADRHNPGLACVLCHNPHSPSREVRK